MNIQNNITSINTNQTLLNTSARNLTNSGSSSSQTDIAKELTDQIVIQNTTESNINAIKTQDGMLGSLLDIKV